MRLLREVKYFKQMNLEVPEEANDIFSKNDTFREFVVSLEMIVENHNFIVT